jgi:hypothetical protein
MICLVQLDTVYAATTRAELDAVVADLPATTLPSRTTPQQVSFAPPQWAPWVSLMPWTLTGVTCLLIWIATSAAHRHLHYFWPFWVIGPWGATLLVHTAIARTRPHNRSTSSNASPARNSAGL